MLGRMLEEAESRSSTAQGAEDLLRNPKRLAAVMEALRRPASGSLYTKWASGSEVKRAGRAAANILRYCSTHTEAGVVLRSVIAAAQAALPIRPETAAALSSALECAETGAAGTEECRG